MRRSGDIAIWAAAAALLIVAGTGTLVLLPQLRTAVGLRTESGYAVGQVVDLPRSWLSPAGFTAVLFLRHSCPSCQAAAPQLQRLVKAAQSRRLNVIVVIGRSTVLQDRQFARSLGLLDKDIREIDVRNLRLATVPTLLLVASDGRIVHQATRGVVATDVDALFRAAAGVPE